MQTFSFHGKCAKTFHKCANHCLHQESVYFNQIEYRQFCLRQYNTLKCIILLKFTSSLSFLGRFWFCLFYLIGLVGASKFLHWIVKFINYANVCKFIQNQWKMQHLYFAADFDSVCFIWYGWVGASKLLHWIVKFINYANLCKFIQNQWKMLLFLYFAADFDSVCFIW